MIISSKLLLQIIIRYRDLCIPLQSISMKRQGDILLPFAPALECNKFLSESSPITSYEGN